MYIDNFPHHQYDLVKLMIVGHLILYIPMQFIVLRHSVVRQIWRTNSEDLIWSRHVTLTVGLLSMMTAFVLHLVSASIASGTAFTFIVNLTGGVSGNYTL